MFQTKQLICRHSSKQLWQNPGERSARKNSLKQISPGCMSWMIPLKYPVAPAFFVGHFFPQRFPSLLLCSQTFIRANGLPPPIALFNTARPLTLSTVSFGWIEKHHLFFFKSMKQKCKKLTHFSLDTQFSWPTYQHLSVAFTPNHQAMKKLYKLRSHLAKRSLECVLCLGSWNPSHQPPSSKLENLTVT